MTPARPAPAPLFIPGNPTGAAAWRSAVAAAARGLAIGSGFTVAFVLRPGRWVDLDTLVESTARGLRDAGVLQPRFVGLDGFVATKTYGTEVGATLTSASADALDGAPPGNPVVEVASAAVPKAGNRDAKRAWRDAIALEWNGAPPLEGRSWADVDLGITGSLFGPLEVVLDALEPVLGRDPRGRDWQEFFPNDDRIEWLRVRRGKGAAGTPTVRLRMGAII